MRNHLVASLGLLSRGLFRSAAPLLAVLLGTAFRADAQTPDSTDANVLITPEAPKASTPTELTATSAPIGSAPTELTATSAPIGSTPTEITSKGDSEPSPSTEVSIEPAAPVKASMTVTPGARLMTGWEIKHKAPSSAQGGPDELNQKFFLQQVRVSLAASLNDATDLEVSADLDSSTLVRDAFVNFKVSKALQLRAGRFKRPFSRIELRGAGKLPFRSRGLFNNALTNSKGYGDRAIGFMPWGKVGSANLRWYAGVFNPGVGTSEPRGIDAAARVEYEPTKSIEIGLNGIHKRTERVKDGPNLHLNGAGVDARLKSGPLYVHLECDLVQNPNPPATPTDTSLRTPLAYGLIAFGTYDVALTSRWVLQPVLVGEWLDTDSEYSHDEAVRGVVGVNVIWDEHVRIMPQLEVIQPLGGPTPRSEVPTQTAYVLLSVEI
jgi:hypothetical protein